MLPFERKAHIFIVKFIFTKEEQDSLFLNSWFSNMINVFFAIFCVRSPFTEFRGSSQPPPDARRQLSKFQ